MEWQPITIELGNNRANNIENKRPSEGLGASPESLHQDFLSDLGHLQEIHNNHQTVMNTNFSNIEKNFESVSGVLSIEAMLDRFDGKVDDKQILLPLHGCELSGIELNTCEINGAHIVKLSVTGINGEELEQRFDLPKGSRLANAIWNDGELQLSLYR